MVNRTLLFKFAPMMLVQILQALEAMGWLLKGTSGRITAADRVANFLEGGKIQAADFQGETFLYWR